MLVLQDVQYYISLYFSQLSPGVDASLGDQLCRDLNNMGKVQDRKLQSPDSQKERQGA